MNRGEFRTEAFFGIGTALASNDPVAAADFLNAYPDDANDRVYERFAVRSFRKAPDLAFQHIAPIENSRSQSEMYRVWMNRWLKDDDNAAATWAQNAHLPENIVDFTSRLMQKIEQGRK